jgi:hypothetical protein
VNGIFYHRTVTYLLTGCLRHGDKLIHPVTVYRDFVDEKGVVKLGSGSPRRRTRRELRIPESVLMRVYDKRRTKIKVQAICGFVQSFLHGGHKWRVMLLSGLNGFMAQE